MEAVIPDGNRGRRMNVAGDIKENCVEDGVPILVSKAEWSLDALLLSPLHDVNRNDNDLDSENTPLLKNKKMSVTSDTTNGSAKCINSGTTAGDNPTSAAATNVVAEIPAVVVTLLINFMTAIPFGVAYFPLGWSNDFHHDDTASTTTSTSTIAGTFPIPGKEILGIRMYLFACITGQIALNLFSSFSSPVSVQLIENIPFYHAMAAVVIAEQGYGEEALATLFFLYGFSSVVTGLMFYGLGKAKLGRVVYYFPSHVLVGFIGGIGVFIVCTSTGVTTGKEFSFTVAGITHLKQHFAAYAPALLFEILLRLSMAVLRNRDGTQKYRLLAPIFFLSIVPMYYLALFFLGVSLEDATDAGAFFPSADPTHEAPDGASVWSGAFDGHVLDVFRVVRLKNVSPRSVARSLPTVVGVSLFSVVNVPINIPAFANTCGVDVDMNQELMAHGYSNVFTGLFGGIQNVMTYSFSVLYYKSGGRSRVALWLLVAGYVLLFVFGVLVMPYIPRCLASTLLLHIGIDLVLEGLYDSKKEYDRIEYTGIIAIVVTMTICGMTPALVAGIVVAMTTYAIQNITYVDPIFTITTAETLRSSAWTRPAEAMSILDSSTTGRSRIMVVQLQANVFFGNIVDMVDTIKERLDLTKPIVVIVDFTLVAHMDSSAAQSINKLKSAMHQVYHVETNIFVMGNHRGYFPCQYGLSTAILKECGGGCSDSGTDGESGTVPKTTPKNQLCVDFDEALILAEDIIIAREDPSLLRKGTHLTHIHENKTNEELTEVEENELAIHYVQNLIRLDPSSSDDQRRDNAIEFLSYFKREVYDKNQSVWKTGAKSDSAKLVVSGKLVASMECKSVSTESNGHVDEKIPCGCFIGELGLIDGVDRLSTVKCESDRAVLFSLDRIAWEELIKNKPAVARILDHVAIRYLSHRVQHVSNRIYETRCLPI